MELFIFALLGALVLSWGFIIFQGFMLRDLDKQLKDNLPPF